MVARDVLDVGRRGSRRRRSTASRRRFSATGIVGGDLSSTAARGKGRRADRAHPARREPASPYRRSSSRRGAHVRLARARRWGIDEARLPAGSAVLFREKTLWSEYRGKILAAYRLLVRPGLLIVTLLVEQRTAAGRRRTWRRPERRYRTVADFTYDWEYWTATRRLPRLRVAFLPATITGYEAAEF